MGAIAVHPDLGRLADLLGDWEGEGRGQWGDGGVFEYREWLHFGHTGKPFVAYAQRTAAADDGRPLHSESGYWRAVVDGVELAVAHSTGVVEIATGRWEGAVLRLRPHAMRTSPTAKAVTALERDFEIDGDTLRYTLRMTRDESPPRWHLSAALARVG